MLCYSQIFNIFYIVQQSLYVDRLSKEDKWSADLWNTHLLVIEY